MFVYVSIGLLIIIIGKIGFDSYKSIKKITTGLTDLKGNYKSFSLWNNYRDTFIDEEYTFDLAEEHYTLDSLYDKDYSINLKAFFNLPQTALGLGILGTFIGLAISTLSLSGIGNLSVDAMTGKVDGLISGMGTAFYTSVVGMVTSMVSSRIVLKVKYNISKLYNEAINSINKKHYKEKIDYLFSMSDVSNDIERKIRPIELLNENYKLAKKNEERMSTFSQDLAIALGNEIQESIGVTMDKLVESNSNGAQDVISGIVENLEESLKNMVHQFKDMISEDTKYELEAMAKMLNSSGEYIQKIPEVLENVLQRLSDQHETHLLHYKDVNEELTKGIDLFKEENLNYANNITSFEELSDNYTFTMKNHQKLIENIDENMGTSLSAIEKAGFSIQNVEEKLKSIAEMHQSIDDVFGIISENINKYENSVGNSLNKYLGEYHNSVDVFTERLESAVFSIKDTIDDVKKIKVGKNETIKAN